jgi:2-dehydropantoate 2-reductase
VTGAPARFVVVGAGAVGGVLAAGLARAGHDVVAVARGPHGEAVRARGLVVESPDGTETVPLAVAAHPGDVAWRLDDQVLLAMKGHQTAAALGDVAAAVAAAGLPPLPVACVQNGVENERLALRWSPDVHGVCVLFPATHLEPGTVRAHWAPCPGMLDVGRYPASAGPAPAGPVPPDDRAEALAGAFRDAGFDARALHDVMRSKRGKLVMNLGNAVEALCGPEARGGPVSRVLEAEGRACLAAAGLPFATADEQAERRRAMPPVRSDPDVGGSTWQSLARGTGSIETDLLNGEIVLLGRLHGVPAPANALVQRLAREHARAGTPPGALAEDALLHRLRAAAPAAN